MTRFQTFVASALAAVLVATGAPTASHAMDRRDEQDAARKAMLDGHVMPFAMIKRRVDREVGDASYLGSEFMQHANRYRLKYVKDGKVIWVDVDGRTGNIIGWAK